MINSWKTDLNGIVEDILPNHLTAIVAGDFNATMKHGLMNGIVTHEDVLDSKPIWNRATWHTDFPHFFGVAIDHILVPKEKYQIHSLEIKNMEVSDHYAIFTELSLK